MMQPLQFDSRDGRYHGVQSDGVRILIDADSYAEARQRRMADDGDSYEAADAATADPDGWSADMEGWIEPPRHGGPRPNSGGWRAGAGRPAQDRVRRSLTLSRAADAAVRRYQAAHGGTYSAAADALLVR